MFHVEHFPTCDFGLRAACASSESAQERNPAFRETSTQNNTPIRSRAIVRPSESAEERMGARSNHKPTDGALRIQPKPRYNPLLFAESP
jgi:hypothetical protein